MKVIPTTVTLALTTGGYRCIELFFPRDDFKDMVPKLLETFKSYNDVKFMVDAGTRTVKYNKGLLNFYEDKNVTWPDRKPYQEANIRDILDDCSHGTVDFLFMDGKWFVTTSSSVKSFRAYPDDMKLETALDWALRVTP